MVKINIMGLFNVIGNMASVAVKTATSPIAVVVDAVDVAMGNEPNNTKKLVNSIGKDLEDSLDELSGEKF